jgi:hypothetical protein
MVIYTHDANGTLRMTRGSSLGDSLAALSNFTALTRMTLSQAYFRAVYFEGVQI